MGKNLDWSNAVVYKITTGDGVYVGSTQNYRERKRNHSLCIYNDKLEKYNYPLYKSIRKNNGKWKIEIYKNFPCDNEWQLRAEEQVCIDELGANLNIQKSIGANKKEWQENNKERHCISSRKYYQNNKKKHHLACKKWHEKNRDKINEGNRVKIMCECGASVSKGGFSQHKKSKKHIAYVTGNC